MKNNVTALFLKTIAIAIAVISITTSSLVTERETGLYDKIFYSYDVKPYNKHFIPIMICAAFKHRNSHSYTVFRQPYFDFRLPFGFIHCPSPTIQCNRAVGQSY